MNLSIVFNSIIIICELIGLFIGLGGEWYLYFTNLSNIFALIGTCFYLYSLMTHQHQRFASLLKYMGVCVTTLTFLVVACILVPMQGIQMLYMGNFLFFHLICPILLFISFVCIDSYQLNKHDYVLGILPTVIYATIVIILNILKIIEGPYPFLMVYDQPIYMSIIWVCVIIGICIIVSKLLLKMKNV